MNYYSVMPASTASLPTHSQTAAQTAARWNAMIDRLSDRQQKTRKPSCSGYEQRTMTDRLPHCVETLPIIV